MPNHRHQASNTYAQTQTSTHLRKNTHTHVHTHTYTPTLTHTHSHKPTHRHIHYIPNYSPDPAHKCLSARLSLFRSLHEYMWPLFRALLPIQETNDPYPVLLVLLQHDAEEAQDHRGRRQGRQPLNSAPPAPHEWLALRASQSD